MGKAVVKDHGQTGAGVKLGQQALAALVLRRPSKGASTKVLRADLVRLRRHLGRPCPHFGKKGVVQLAAPAAAAPAAKGSRKVLGEPGGTVPVPRFNKYAGWAEWQNAVFLWVNAAGGSFENTFRHGGRQVNWYVGGARPTEDSPIVRRLLGTAKGASGAKQTRVLIFVRPHALKPYVYCGACGYVSHNPRKKGFEFTWELRDFPALSAAPAFKELMGAQKAPLGRVVERWT